MRAREERALQGMSAECGAYGGERLSFDGRKRAEDRNAVFFYERKRDGRTSG